jgi:hypothetical protein
MMLGPDRSQPALRVEPGDGRLGGDDREILDRDEQRRIREGLRRRAQNAPHHRLAGDRDERLVADPELRRERIERSGSAAGEDKDAGRGHGKEGIPLWRKPIASRWRREHKGRRGCAYRAAGAGAMSRSSASPAFRTPQPLRLAG